jgi:hypothetical protein
MAPLTPFALKIKSFPAQTGELLLGEGLAGALFTVTLVVFCALEQLGMVVVRVKVPAKKGAMFGIFTVLPEKVKPLGATH